MLLTLTTDSLRELLDDQSLTVLDMPGFVIEKLCLRGLNIAAAALSGWSLSDLDALRDSADKAACPCLVLIQSEPLPLADPKPSVYEDALSRVERLATAANRLGCNALAIHCLGEDTDEVFDMTADRIRSLMGTIEQLELNLLIAPREGVTNCPDRLTDLIKRVGGFRIGSFPDFGHAAASGDATRVLRKLAPYAGAVRATINGFNKKGVHADFDLAECVRAIRSVGFANTLAIDFQGNKNAVSQIERGRDVLQAAIDSDEE